MKSITGHKMSLLSHLLVYGGLLFCLNEVRAQSFTEVASDLGLTHNQHSISAREALQPYTTGGACAGDFNGDGFVDLYVTILDGPDILYQNQNGTGFVDVTATAFGANHLAEVETNGCAWGDIDNDGDLDLYVTSIGSTRYHLYINSGAPNYTFTEEAVGRGAALSSPDVHKGMSVAFGDANLDGYLDLHVTEWRTTDDNPEGAPHNNRLLINLGQFNPGHFIDHTYFAGVATDAIPVADSLDSQGYAPRFVDMDRDGVQDLLLASDHGTSRLWWGNGDGTYLDGTDAAGVGTDTFGMGSTVGDYDGDGDLDWFVTSIYEKNSTSRDGNRLYRYDGNRNFTDVTDLAGVRDGDWGWGAAFFDFDHDQDLDLIMANGTRFPLSQSTTQGFHSDRTVLFENDGTGGFADISGSGSGISDKKRGKGLVLLDYDNDGDLDVFIANNGAKPVFYENQTDGAGDWLKIRLQGVESNRQGIGALVSVIEHAGSTPLLRFNDGGSNFLGQNEAGVHVGLGAPEATPLHAVLVHWPNGRLQVLQDVARNQLLEVIEPAEEVAPKMVLSAESLHLGEVLMATFDESSLPTGWTATWRVDGQSFANPLNIQPAELGEVVVLLELHDDSVEPQLMWSESRRVDVRAAHESTVARLWNEQNLDAIRIDFPDPTKHARNLFHTSVAMWDAWAAYDPEATGYVHREEATAADIEAARHEAISYAAFRVLVARYVSSEGAPTTLARLGALMTELGYDTSNASTEGDSPAALGNRVAAAVLAFGDWDGWNEEEGFLGEAYSPANDPLHVDEISTALVDPNRWQPLLFEVAITQNGIPTNVIQTFLGSNWGAVRPFALPDLTDSNLHVDPGPPPQWGAVGDALYKSGSLDVVRYSSLLDPTQSSSIDISPGAYGNSTLGTNDGVGHELNPATGLPYPPNVVLHADLGRVLAEFWADGPDSETPPGHWNTLANEVVEHPDFERRFQGEGDIVDPLEWDVFMYFVLNGSLHDSAVAAWGCKRVYDYIRPISSIRFLCSLGQSSDPDGPSYHPGGMPLEAGLVEVITAESSQPGERHEHLAAHVGKVAIYAWLGEVANPQVQTGGVGWMLGEAWMPYQRSTFVTPAFAGYVSGHSTFSRAAAEVMTRLTGSAFFPGGMATFEAGEDDFLAFENGPSTDVVLQWATYYDAADQAGISRLYGGIHVPVDDGPGRIMGSHCGIEAWKEAIKYRDGSIRQQTMQSKIEIADDDSVDVAWDSIRGFQYRIHSSEDLVEFAPETPWLRAGDLESISNFDHLQGGAPSKYYIIERE